MTIIDDIHDRTGWFYDQDTENDVEADISNALTLKKTNNDTLEAIFAASGDMSLGF